MANTKTLPIAANSALSIVDRDRLMAAGAALHRCGPRCAAELLVEVAEREGGVDWLLGRLDVYLRLPPDLYAAVGADRLPPAPLSEVRRR